MPYKFLDIVATPSVQAAQAANGTRQMWENFKGHRTFDRFTENEVAFIEERDSFYMATVSESGWPYVQHRGGPPGFIHILDEKTLAIPDFRGNRQYISTGNLAAKLALPGYRAKVERGLIMRLVAFDWNCPQHITQRLSEAELEPALAPLARAYKEELSAPDGANLR